MPMTIATRMLWPGTERPSTRVSTTRSNSAPITKIDQRAEQEDQQIRQPEPEQREHAEIAAEHHHLAAGEIDDVARFVDDDQRQRDQRIDAAGDDAAGDPLEEKRRHRARGRAHMPSLPSQR